MAPLDVYKRQTLTCTYNDLASVRAAFEQYPQEIACIIVEPVAGNMNCVPPLPEFLPGLRALCDEFGALLIIDEVMTGFRVALAGAQAVSYTHLQGLPHNRRCRRQLP